MYPQTIPTTRRRWSRRFLALAATVVLSPAASAQITAPGTDYPTFWSGELRVFAQQPETRVTLVNLDDETVFSLPGNENPDPRVFGGPCFIITADGAVTEAPSNPFVLESRGSMFRCTGGLGGPNDEIRVRVMSEDASGGEALTPVTVWTGSTVGDVDNAWGSFLPSDLGSGQTFGREIGTDFVGFTQSEAIIIAPRVAATTTSLNIARLDSGSELSIALDASVPTCPALSAAVPPIDPAATPCYLHDGPELQVLYDGNYADDRLLVSSNVEISVLTGHRLMAFTADELEITHESADWTVTPPSWRDGDEGVELGTEFYTFARQALTIFPTAHDTTVQIVDLSDGDDSREVFLEHGDVFTPKDPAAPRLSVFTSILASRTGDGIVARTAEPEVLMVTADENPFDNDVVKITSDKPVLVYQGPAASDVNEFADVAFSVPIDAQERLVYCYGQNFGDSNDLQLFSFPGSSEVTIVSLTYTAGFRGINPVPGHHDFLIDFFDDASPEVAPWPAHGNFVTHGVPGGVQHFGSGTWSGELLAIRSQRPMTVINGDYDTAHFGAYVPFVPTSRELPPVARISAESVAACVGSSLAVSGEGSFDQDAEGDPPQIVTYDWDFGDGTRLTTSDSGVRHSYTAAGTYTATLTVTDNEGTTDTDFLDVTLLPPGAEGCEECAPCEGKVSELALRYDGVIEDPHIEVIQRKDGIEVFDGTVRPGEEFLVIGGDKKGTLGTEIEVWINGALHVKIHTSCSQPIGVGSTFGDVTVVGGRSRLGGLLCPLDGDGGDDTSCACEGKVVELALQYVHATAAGRVEVVQKDAATVFDAVVQPGEIFSFIGTHRKGTLGTEIRIYVDGQRNATIHTSCSQPIGPGLVRGDFLVVSGRSRTGGALCEIGRGEDPEDDSDGDGDSDSDGESEPESEKDEKDQEKREQKVGKGEKGKKVEKGKRGARGKRGRKQRMSTQGSDERGTEARAAKQKTKKKKGKKSRQRARRGKRGRGG